MNKLINKKFILTENIGNFSKNDTIIVESVNIEGDDVRINFKNDKGIKDTFILDKKDVLE